jgi:hypothetical protein
MEALSAFSPQLQLPLTLVGAEPLVTRVNESTRLALDNSRAVNAVSDT